MKLLSSGLLLLLIAAIFGWSGAEGAEPVHGASVPGETRTYVFDVDLPHNPQRLYEIYRPLIDHLNLHVQGAGFRLETSPDCEAFINNMHARHFDFALTNAHQTLDSLDLGYRVIARMADDHQFVGVVLVRRDSGIREVADLRGKRVAYPRPNCLMGAIMPQYYLQTHGLDVNRDIENLYVGSHESSIMNVFLGNVAAAGVRRPSWEMYQREHPEQAGELVARWQTEPLLNVGVIARDDVPREVTEQVAQQLQSLHTTDEGRAILGRIPLSRFDLSDDSHYLKRKAMLQKVYRTIRPHKDPCP